MAGDVGSALVAGITAAGASGLVIAGLGWKARDWFANKFDELQRKIDDNQKVNDTRHIQNLAHFADIGVTLARKGIRLVRSSGDGGE